jgi:hypothetical protein
MNRPTPSSVREKWGTRACAPSSPRIGLRRPGKPRPWAALVSTPFFALALALASPATAQDRTFTHCPEGGCVVTCARGQSCTSGCAGGKCKQTCSPGATCTFTCPGGNCTQTCKETSRCTLMCAGGGCTQSCEGAERCAKTCAGGGCK